MSPDQTFDSEDLANKSSVVEAQFERSDVNRDINAGPPRRSAWNRPSNGVFEAGSVMGGTVSWPALSESTRPVMRSSSMDTSRPMADGSLSSSQVVAAPQSSLRQAKANNHINSSPNNPRSRNRGAGSSSGSATSRSTASQQFAAFGVPYPIGTSVLDNSMTGAKPVLGVGGSQSHIGNDHSSNRNHSRRVNYGPRTRGEGQYHNNHGGRRDHDRRDVHVIPPYMTPPIRYMTSPRPPTVTSFIPSTVAFFPGQMGFDFTPIMYSPTLPPESFRTMPTVEPLPPPPPPFFFTPSNEGHLTNLILKQIDYYFSDENLVRDDFLRKKMDGNGWVPISLIASFRRVQNLTNDIPMILESLRHSTIVEVQGEKLRRRKDWNRWLLSSGHPNNDFTNSSEYSLASSLQGVSLNESNIVSNGKEESLSN